MAARSECRAGGKFEFFSDTLILVLLPSAYRLIINIFLRAYKLCNLFFFCTLHNYVQGNVQEKCVLGLRLKENSESDQIICFNMLLYLGTVLHLMFPRNIK